MRRPLPDLRSVAGCGVLGAALLVTGVGLVGSPFGAETGAGATTVAEDVRGTVTLVEGGASRPLASGDVVPQGAVVRTADRSAVVLATAGRTVEVGPGSGLEVVDGTHQELTAGLVLVDSRKGPQLSLATEAAEVRTAKGVARVERGDALRVVAYAGGGVEVQPAGRRSVTAVPALFESSTEQGGTPSGPNPLRLTLGDTWEKRSDVAGRLVADDLLLEGLATGLDQTGDALRLAAKVPAALREIAPLPPNAPASSEALGYAVARASEAFDDDADDEAKSYYAVRTGRDNGGSWGVLAALVQARTSPATAVLDDLLASLAPAVTGPAGPVPPTPDATGPDDLLGPVIGGLTPDTPVVPTTPGTPTTPDPTGPTTPPASPTTPPSTPTPEPTVPNVVDTLVGGVVGTLDGLLGTLQPQTTAPAAPPAGEGAGAARPGAKAPTPAPTHTPLISLGGLSLF